jgi:pilin isopeptide linkage protein
MPSNTTVTITNDTLEHSASFDEIKFTQEGTFNFIIEEVDGDDTHMEYDLTERKVTIVATDTNNDGQLEFNVDYSGNNDMTIKDRAVFINTYKPLQVTLKKITGEKTVTTTDGSDYQMKAGQFKFEMSSFTDNPSDDPLTSSQVFTNDANGKLIFARELTYTSVNTYRYIVKELDSKSSIGVSIDPIYYVVTVETYEDNGQLETKVSYHKYVDGKEHKAEGVLFDNTYDPDNITVILGGDKVLKGKTVPKGEFTFTLKALDDNAPMPSSNTVKNIEDGSFTFGAITYNQEGVYHYQIAETDDGKSYYTYDKSNYDVTVTITKEDSIIQKEVTITSGGKSVDSITFENEYHTSGNLTLQGTKKLTGKTLKAGEFVFELKDENGKTIDTATNTKDGTFTFDTIRYTKAGRYHYSVVEKDTKETGVTYDKTTYFVDVKAIDEGKGQLSITTLYSQNSQTVNKITFKNVYKKAKIKVIKDKTKKKDTTKETKKTSGVKTSDDTNNAMWISIEIASVTLLGGLILRKKIKQNLR